MKISIARKKAEERKRSGLPPEEEEETQKVSMRGGQKTVANTRKLMEAPQRLLEEEDINAIYKKLSKEGRKKVDGYVNLTCGRGG